MYTNKIALCLVVLVAAIFLAGCTATTQQTGPGTYVIKYVPAGSSQQVEAVVTKTSDGSYRLDNGTLLNPTRNNVIEKGVVVTSSTTGTSSSEKVVCQCNCCPSEKPTTCENPTCVEPEPKELYLCANGKTTANKGDCNPELQCVGKATGKITYCVDGTQVKDPRECGGVASMSYVCTNGNVVSTAEECGCATTVPVTTVAYFGCTQYNVSSIKYKCVDGSDVTDPSKCGNGGGKTVYICSDGSQASQEADCSSRCPQPTYSASIANVPTGAVKLVYQCWDGSIVNEKGRCPLYCSKECNCPDYESPVCGDNGKTYRNTCFARCAGISVIRDGICPEYTCLKTNAECIPTRSDAPLSTIDSVAYINPTAISGASSIGTGSTAEPTYSIYSMNIATRPMCCPGTECSADRTSSTGYRCAEPQTPPPVTCYKVGERCVIPSMTTTVYNPNQNMSGGCCAGSICNANGICEVPTTTPECLQNGKDCKQDSQCCNKYCDQNKYVCTDRPTPVACINEGNTCIRSTTTATAYNPAGNCCSGLICNANSICERPQTCLKTGATCTDASKCCDGYCNNGVCSDTPPSICYTEGQTCASMPATHYVANWTGGCCSGLTCSANKVCVKPTVTASCLTTGSCSSASDCCSGYYCSQELGCQPNQQCSSAYCDASGAHSGCAFNREAGRCVCSSDTQCPRGCNTDGLTCAPSCLTQGSCTSDGACCSGYYCNQEVGCQRGCRNSGNSCTVDNDCCSGMSCTSGVCTVPQPACPYEYCTGGTFYSSCSTNSKTGACSCLTTVKCQSGRCNTKGTGCS